MSEPSGDDYKELCQTRRHYSNLRWIMLPVFMTVNGGLFYGARDTIAAAVGACDLRRWVPLIAAVLFIEFFRQMDLVLDAYLNNYSDYARRHFPTGHRSADPGVRGKVRRLMNRFYRGWMIVWGLYVIAPLLNS